MNKSEQFNKWYADHFGHPHHVRFAKSAIDEQQQEIALQNAQLLDAGNEITALKAMVNSLSSAALKLHQNIYFLDDDEAGRVDDKFVMLLAKALNKTPVQHLASVKADSFKDGAISMGCELVNEHESNFPGGEVQICAIVQVVILDNKAKNNG